MQEKHENWMVINQSNDNNLCNGDPMYRQCKPEKPKKVFIYDKVDNYKRSELLRLVKEENCTLKEAAEKLKINYSTAKTIIRVYRKENRIFKKSSLGMDQNQQMAASSMNYSLGMNNNSPTKINIPIANHFSTDSSLNLTVDHKHSSESNSSNNSGDIQLLQHKIKRDVKHCSRNLKLLWKEVTFNKQMLQNIAFVFSFIINNSQYLQNNHFNQYNLQNY